MEGAKLNNSDLTVTIVPDVSVVLSSLTFKWVRVREIKGQVKDDEIETPVYLNKLRKNLIFSFRVYIYN